MMRLSLPFDGATARELVKAVIGEAPPSLPEHYSDEIKFISLGVYYFPPLSTSNPIALYTYMIRPPNKGPDTAVINCGYP